MYETLTTTISIRNTIISKPMKIFSSKFNDTNLQSSADLFQNFKFVFLEPTNKKTVKGRNDKSGSGHAGPHWHQK